MFGRGGGTVQTTFTAKDNMSPVVRGIRSTMDQFKRDAATGFGLAGGISIFNMATRAFGAVTDYMGDALNAASDLGEQQSKTTAVFKDQADEVLAWSRSLDVSFGVSERAALTAASSFGNLFTSMGLGVDEASRMSQGLVELAGDLASFNNQDIQEVLTALQSGIVGETEPVRRLGIDLLDASVSAEALALGLKDTAKQLTFQDKMVARYSLIMKQTANAQGDAARTADSLAGQQRQLNANFENMQTQLGALMVGPAADFLGWLNNVFEQVRPTSAAIQEFIDKQRELKNAMEETVDPANALVQAFTLWTVASDPARVIPAEFAKNLRYLGEAAGQSQKDIHALWYFLRNDLGLSFEEAAAEAERFLRSLILVGEKSTPITPLLYGLGDAADDTATDFKALGTQLGKTFGTMFGTLNDAKEPWREAFKDLARWAKDPFRPDAFEQWMNRQARKFIQRAEDALADGRPGVARRSRQIAAAIENPIVRSLVNIGVKADDAVFALLAVQRLGRTVGAVSDSIFGAVGGFLGSLSGNGGVEGGGRRGGRRGRRAAGGPVNAGEEYIVGERGPERLVMGNRSGHITPNHQMSGHGHDIVLDGVVVGRLLDRHQGRALNFIGSSAR